MPYWNNPRWIFVTGPYGQSVTVRVWPLHANPDRHRKLMIFSENGLSNAELLCEYLHNMVGKQKSNQSKCWDKKNKRIYQSGKFKIKLFAEENDKIGKVVCSLWLAGDHHLVMWFWLLSYKSRAFKVLDTNVQEINIEMSQCSSKQKCQQNFQDKVTSALAGMSKTKASHMKNWLQEKFNLQLSWNSLEGFQLIIFTFMNL